jgi:hypothetical protein
VAPPRRSPAPALSDPRLAEASFTIGATPTPSAPMATTRGSRSAVPMRSSASAHLAEEAPPNDSKGTGMLEATYDSSSKQLSYTADYSGLTRNATMAHFHGPAEPGKNAPIVVPVQGRVASPVKGTATLTDAQAAELLAGKLDFNVPIQKNKGSEIRGQSPIRMCSEAGHHRWRYPRRAYGTTTIIPFSRAIVPRVVGRAQEGVTVRPMSGGHGRNSLP